MKTIPRIIPALTIRDRLLVKPLKFGKEKYIGDPVNAVRIFNEKLVDEIVFIDLTASENPGNIDFEFLEEMASEAFMPVAYGGGVNTPKLAHQITNLGIEKIVINTGAMTHESLISEISNEIGSQSTVVSIDVKRKLLGGYDAYSNRGTHKIPLSPIELAKKFVSQGAGEVLLQSIDRESTFDGYDLRIVEEVSRAVAVPVIASGGARGMEDFRAAVRAGASAVAAGSNFVLQGKHRAVLITYPTQSEIRDFAD